MVIKCPSRNSNLRQSVTNSTHCQSLITILVYMSGFSICRAEAQNKAGFVYFGMHGALPVYSLQHSPVEGKMTLLHNAI